MSGTPSGRSAAKVRATAGSAKRANSRGASSPAHDSNSMSAWAPARACAAGTAAMASASSSEQPLGGVRLRVQQRARRAELLGGLAAHEVAQERERRAGEADERHAARHAGAHQADGLQHERHVALGHQRGQRIHLGVGADGLAHVRAGREVERHAHALQRGHDVAEEDGGIELEAPQRLQGHLGGQLGGARQRLEVDLGAHARGTPAGSARPGASPIPGGAAPAGAGRRRGRRPPSRPRATAPLPARSR